MFSRDDNKLLTFLVFNMKLIKKKNSVGDGNSSHWGEWESIIFLF